jgi:DNA-binding winged helix-turn-helix (wHTH) protein
MRWRFGELELDLERCELRRGEATVQLQPKVADLLCHLLRNAGRVVPQRELLDAVWPDTVVTGSSVVRGVSVLREGLRAIGESGAILRTVARRGYLIDVPARPVEEREARLTPDSSFVGRVHELEVLEAALRSARDGHGGAALVVGDGGIGKTALLGELARRAAPSAAVSLARCRAEAEPVAFAPWIELLNGVLVHPSDSGERIPAATGLAELLPRLGASPGTSDARDPEAQRHAISTGVVRALRRAAQTRLLLLVLDDLHLADASSLLLAAEVAEQLADTRVLLLAARRPLAELEGDRRDTTHASRLTSLTRFSRAARNLELHGFTREEVERYVVRNAVRAPGPNTVETLFRRSGGSPLFVRELLFLHEEPPSVQHERVVAAREVPATLALVIGERLAALPTPVRELLERAAAVGREFSLAVLARSAGVNEAAALDLLAVAEKQRVVAAVEENPDAFAFGHELLRDVLYADLSSARRVEIHATIADALDALHAEDADPPWSELARHHGEAAVVGGAARASECAERAGHRALEQLAFEEAAVAYRSALRFLERAPTIESKRRCALLMALADAHYYAGEGDEAERGYREALRIAQEIGDLEALAAAVVRLTHRQRGNVGAVPWERIAILEECLERLPQHDGALRASLLTALATDLAWADSQRARHRSDEAMAMARRLGGGNVLLRAISSRFQLLVRPEDAAERYAISEEEVALASVAGDRIDELFAHYHRFGEALARSDAPGVDDSLAACERLADASEDPVHAGYAEAARACRALWRGELLEAETASRAAGRSLTDGRSRDIGFLVSASQLYVLRRFQGRLGELEPLLVQGERAFPALPAFGCARALILAETGRPAEARQALAQLFEGGGDPLRFTMNRHINLALLAETAALLGDAERSSALHRELDTLALHNLTLQSIVCLGSIERYRGLTAFACGELDAAVVHLEQALVAETRARARPFEAYAACDCARVRLARGGAGDLEAVRALALRAATIAQAVGMPALAAQADHLLAGLAA